MIYTIIYVIAFCFFLTASLLPLQLIFTIVNYFIPDPIPIIDEALMTASIIKKILSLVNVMEFVHNHPKLSKIIAVACGCLVIVIFIII